MKKLNNKGFTLIEMVIVIVIIAILAAMLVPSLLSYVDNANRKSFMSACDTIKTNVLSTSSEKYANGGNATLAASDLGGVTDKLGGGASLSVVDTVAAASKVQTGNGKNNYVFYVDSWGKSMKTMIVANGSYYGVFSDGQWTIYDADGNT